MLLATDRAVNRCLQESDCQRRGLIRRVVAEPAFLTAADLGDCRRDGLPAPILLILVIPDEPLGTLLHLRDDPPPPHTLHHHSAPRNCAQSPIMARRRSTMSVRR